MIKFLTVFIVILYVSRNSFGQIDPKSNRLSSTTSSKASLIKMSGDTSNVVLAEKKSNLTTKKNEIDFELKLNKVDSDSATFEISDDNVTTINYLINYSFKNIHNAFDSLKRPIIEETSGFKKFEMQTNSMSLITKQEAKVKNSKNDLQSTNMTLFKSNQSDYGDDDSEEVTENSNLSGERYSSIEIMDIKARKWEDIHHFVIEKLQENRFYEINFTITATLAHLRETKRKANNQLASKTTTKNFQFNFQTTFDIDAPALKSCLQNTDAESLLLSCYVPGTNCTKCKPNCYQVESERSSSSTKISKGSNFVLCEACPCDPSRSSGECVEIENDLTKQKSIKCKQCLKPYSGQLCDECENEGFDSYKTDYGECLKCECNNNAALDNLNLIGSNQNINKRKCQAFTGVCNDCMFNTSGRHCDECIVGFRGSPIKRTCVPYKTANQYPAKYSSSSTQNYQTKTGQNSNKTNRKYNLKSIALLVLYISCILFLVLVTYLCIRVKTNNDSSILKDGPLSSPIFCGLFNWIFGAFNHLNESTRNHRARLGIMFSSLCPNLANRLGKLRTTHILSNSGYDPSNNNNHILDMNDDDRLNLAEYQVIDDGLYAMEENGKSYIFRANIDRLSDNEDLQNMKNPYQSLTIKT